MHRAVARLGRYIEVALSPHDLSLPQYRLLAFLAECQRAASDLADLLAVSRPSVTALVDGLEARGYVERHHSEDDRRRVNHVLTSAGRRALCTADEAVKATIADLLTSLDPESRQRATDGLSLLARAIDNHCSMPESGA